MTTSNCEHKFMDKGRCWSEGCTYCLHKTTFSGTCVACNYINTKEAEAAKLKEKQYFDKLLRKKKLPLIIDLDNTLVHATAIIDVADWVRTKRRNTKERHRLRGLVTILDGQCTIKLRPGLMKFLKSISKIYELHIYTMGTQSYANAILNKIDPNRSLFRGCILSRDGNGGLTKKKLERLFPTVSSSVVILDDNSLVWDNHPNVIQIQPYYFFKDDDEINTIYTNYQDAETTAASTSAADGTCPILNYKNIYANNTQETNNGGYSDDEDEILIEEPEFAVPALPFSVEEAFSIPCLSDTPQAASSFLERSVADIIPSQENDHALKVIDKLLHQIHVMYFQEANADVANILYLLNNPAASQQHGSTKRKRGLEPTDEEDATDSSEANTPESIDFVEAPQKKQRINNGLLA